MPGRIGRVRLSKTGSTLFNGDGQDTLYPGRVDIDADVRDEYWREVRGMPSNAGAASYRSLGAYAKHATR